MGKDEADCIFFFNAVQASEMGHVTRVMASLTYLTLGGRKKANLNAHSRRKVVGKTSREEVAPLS